MAEFLADLTVLGFDEYSILFKKIVYGLRLLQNYFLKSILFFSY